jgi:hypothetical protein
LVERISICNGLQALLVEDLYTIARTLPTLDVMAEDLKVVMYILAVMKEENRKNGKRLKRDI